MPAVNSGRSVSKSPPRSGKVYISFDTTSVVSPIERANTSVASNTGSLDPLEAIEFAARGRTCRRRARSGVASSPKISWVPRTRRGVSMPSLGGVSMRANARASVPLADPPRTAVKRPIAGWQLGKRIAPPRFLLFLAILIVAAPLSAALSPLTRERGDRWRRSTWRPACSCCRCGRCSAAERGRHARACRGQRRQPRAAAGRHRAW